MTWGNRSAALWALLVMVACWGGSAVAQMPSLRADATKKGSLLVYPAVEVKWGVQAGLRIVTLQDLIQDTFLSITNDAAEEVSVQFYFVNGDDPLEAITAGSPPVVVERAHPGWNNVDCEIRLTPDQSLYFSAASGQPLGCQQFSILDGGLPPGRPDNEATLNGRMVRGMVFAWAVAGGNGAAAADVGKPITYNHLSGKATTVDYLTNSAHEYNAYAFRGLGQQGQVIRTCEEAAGIDVIAFGINPANVGVQANGFLTQVANAGNIGVLCMDGVNYDFAFDRLLMDFFATGSVALSGSAFPGILDTDLTLHPLSIDLRQDNRGAVTTKAKFDIWNQNENRFSGTERCISCWDQVLLGRFNTPNHFLLGNLQTDKGKARINGVASEAVCDTKATDEIGRPLCENAMGLVGICSAGGFIRPLCVDNIGELTPCSEDAALLGVAVKELSFAIGTAGKASSTLVGMGEETAYIINDVVSASSELNVDYEVVDVVDRLMDRSSLRHRTRK